MRSGSKGFVVFGIDSGRNCCNLAGLGAFGPGRDGARPQGRRRADVVSSPKSSSTPFRSEASSMNPFSHTLNRTIVDVSSDLSELWSSFPKIIPNYEFPITCSAMILTRTAAR